MIEKLKSPWRRRDDQWNDDREIPSKMSGKFRRVVRSVAILLGVAVIGGSIAGGVNMWLARRSEQSKLLAVENGKSQESALNAIEGSPVESNPVAEVLGENDLGSIGVLSSENYRVGQIVLGGDVGLLSQGDELTELGINDIRGETLSSKNQNEGRALITWRTSKAAKSTLTYSKTAGGSEKSIDEDGFGMSHSAVLSNLDLSSTYLYTVTVRDRYGNEVTSDPHAVYTGTRVVSLFELITNALQEVFGWAVKK
ncbi:MAG: fibronectin type III domain-containing protein [Candidatus Moraniibacteriota bacterium]|nr:MAG: fibronectin type III domain-containing protein [Candidatus Moranbacteria bacterium]